MASAWPGITGLLTGFNEAHQRYRDEQLQLEGERNRRASEVYSLLLQHGTPEMQSLAAAGMLDEVAGGQRKGGLRGWIGDMQGSATLGKIRDYIATPTGTTLPSRNITGTVTDQPGTAAQPATQTTRVGQPPPVATSPDEAIPFRAEPTPATVGQPPPTGPGSVSLHISEQTPGRPQFRQVLQTPEEQAVATARGKSLGDIAGEEAALTSIFGPEQGREILRQDILRQHAGAASVESIPGELPDGRGGVRPAFGVFDRVPGSPTFGKYIDPNTHLPLEGFQPRTSTASTSFGPDYERMASILYGVPYAQIRSDSTKTAQVEAAVQARKQQLGPKDALAAASRMLPNAPVEQQEALARALQAETTPSSTVGQPPPVAGTVPAPAGQTPPTPQTGLGSQTPPALATATRETGKPLPTQVQTALAGAKSTNDLIDQALLALEPFKGDNNPQTTYALAEKYRSGQFDPIGSAVSQLADLAGLQASARQQLTAGSSRALRYYVDRRQHVPILPSARQSTFHQAGVPSGVIGGVTRLLKDEGSPDSPQAMYQKLLAARANNESFIKEIEAAAQQTKPGTLAPMAPVPAHTVGQPPPSSGPGYVKNASGGYDLIIR